MSLGECSSSMVRVRTNTQRDLAIQPDPADDAMGNSDDSGELVPSQLAESSSDSSTLISSDSSALSEPDGDVLDVVEDPWDSIK